MQSKSTFPARIAPFSVLEPLPFSRVGLRKAHAHAHGSMYIFIHVAACLQLCLPPPASPPLAHSNRMPQRMYASVPQCMPISRLGLIYNTMPSHIRKPFSKSLVNVRVRGMYVCVHVTKGRLKACVCLHVSVCICVCKCICVAT